MVGCLNHGFTSWTQHILYEPNKQTYNNTARNYLAYAGFSIQSQALHYIPFDSVRSRSLAAGLELRLCLSAEGFVMTGSLVAAMSMATASADLDLRCFLPYKGKIKYDQIQNRLQNQNTLNPKCVQTHKLG